MTEAKNGGALDRLRHAIGQALEHRGRFQLAERAYARKNYQVNPHLAFAVGNVRYRQGRFAEAIPDLETAVTSGVRTRVATDRLAIAIERAGTVDRAIDLLSKNAQETSDAAARLRLASLLERTGSIAEAHGNYLLALELGSADEAARGVERTMPKDAPLWQAVATLMRVRHVHADDSDWRYGLACKLFDLARYEESAKEFDAACDLSPRSWWNYRAGLAWELTPDPERAKARYDQAVLLDSKHGASRWGLGAFHEEAKNWDLAAAAYAQESDRATEIWRRAGLAYRAAGCYEAVNDLAAAVRMYRRAVELRPLDAAWNLALGNASELAGDREGALAAYSRVVAIGDAKSVEKARFRQGVVLHAASRYSESLAALKAWKGIASPSDAEDGSTTEQPEAFTFPTLGGGVGDVRTYRERGALAALAGQHAEAVLAFRSAALQKRPIDGSIAEPYSAALEATGDIAGACSALIDTVSFTTPVPRQIETFKRRSYAEKTALYAEWRENAQVQDDLIVYESNLGISIDCNPLAICREILRHYPSKYIHLWSVEGDVPVPEDLASSDRVVIVQKNSDAMVHALATAKYLVNNSTFPTYFTRRDEQTYLMTWHGTPLKTLGKHMPDPLVHANMARNYLQATHAIFPNEHTRSALIDGTDVHGVLRAKVEITGYPRNDALQKPLSNAQPVALFAPTWRDESLLEQQVQALAEVSRCLRAAGYRPLLRAHPYAERAAKTLAPELEFVERSVPTNDLLPEVDLLVTDFSSIYFDFAITGRPIVFYVPDWDEYANSRGVYFDKSHLPGDIVESIPELETALAHPVVNESRRQEFLDEFAPRDDGKAGERAVSLLLDDEDFVRSLAVPSVQKGYLIRQSLIPNGMASSFVNLATQLADQGVEPTVLTEAESVRTDAARQETLARVPESARIIGRVGAQPKTRFEYHASRVVARRGSVPSLAHLERLMATLFARESRRTLGNVGFECAIEFDGYSEFMARLVAAIGDVSPSSAIYLHNDIAAEIDLRLPELVGVVRLLPRFRSVIAVSEGLRGANAERLGSRYGIDVGNFTFARNSIVPDRLRALAREPHPAQIEQFLESGDRVVVHAGRFSREKNHDFLLDLACAVAEQDESVRFVFMGDGPRFQEVRARAIALGLEDSILFPGRLSNPYPLIARADAFVLPSLHEGQPMVILEARTLGTRVIASDIPSTRAMGSDGANLILPLDVERWVDAIVSWNRTVDESFDSQRYVEATLREFREAVGSRPVRPGR